MSDSKPGNKAAWLVAGAAISIGMNLLLGGMVLTNGKEGARLDRHEDRIVALEITMAAVRSEFAYLQTTVRSIDSKVDRLIDSLNNHMKESRQ